MRTVVFVVVACVSSALAFEVSAGEFQEGKVIEFNHAPGPYDEQKYSKDFGKPDYVILERSQIVTLPAGQKALQVTTPAKEFGWQRSGAHIMTPIPARDECVLEYDVRLGEENGEAFDFRRGGKLPGLAGGKSNSGGRKPTGDGWTCRYMWREGGELVVYLYHLDQTGIYGDDIPLKIKAEPGKWYKLRMHIVLNTNDKKNGILKISVNDKQVLERKDIRYRLGKDAQIDHFLFAHFWGGQDESWAPHVTSTAYFRKFVLVK